MNSLLNLTDFTDDEYEIRSPGVGRCPIKHYSSCHICARYVLFSSYMLVSHSSKFDYIIFNRTKIAYANVHDLLPPKRTRVLRKRGHNFIQPKIRTERFKGSFVNRCLFQLYSMIMELF